MNISLPERFREFVDFRMEKGGFCNASEYIRHLIREDHKRMETEELQRLIKEGYESGPPTPMTKQDWEDIRRRVRERAAARQRKSA